MKPFLILPAVAYSAQVTLAAAEVNKLYVARDGTLIQCTNNHLASLRDIQNIIGNLKTAGLADPVDIKPGGCRRIGCESNAAVWWCNLQEDPIERGNGDLSNDVKNIVDKCQLPDGRVGGTNTNLGVSVLSVISGSC